MKNKASKLVSVLLSASMLFFVACSRADKDLEGEYVPVVGEMMGVSLAGDDLNGFAIELTSGGKGSLSVDGEAASLKWENDDTKVTITADGETMEASHGDDTLVFDDMLGMGMKITFAKKGSEAADPSKYLPDSDKELLGTWKSSEVTDILGDPVDESEMKADAIQMTIKGDHTADIKVEGADHNGLKWVNLGDYGSIDDESIDISWKKVDGGISLDYVKDGEYYTFFCAK